MKLSLAYGVMFGTLLFGLFASPVYASDPAKVTVPFPFLVNNRVLPAGQYEVRTNGEDPAIVEIEGVDHPSAHADVATVSETRRDHNGNAPSLTFVRRNGMMELSEYLESGDNARGILVRQGR